MLKNQLNNSFNYHLFSDFGVHYFANNKRKSEISEQLQDLTLTVDSAAKSSLINAPFPLIIIETDGNVVWKSSKFITEFANIVLTII